MDEMMGDYAGRWEKSYTPDARKVFCLNFFWLVCVK